MEMKNYELRAFVAKCAYDHDYGKNVHKLFNCSATVIDCASANIIVLKSYNTYVAYYDKDYEYVTVFGNYSTATSQHCRKFVKWLSNSNYNVKAISYPYRRSDHLLMEGVNEVASDTGELYWREYATYARGKECGYVKEGVRREMNRDIRSWYNKTYYKSLCNCPLAYVDTYVLMSANHEQLDSFVNRWYGYTVR